MAADLRETEIVAPNFKRRLSGVTSTIVQLVPKQVALGTRIVTLGPGLPPHLPKLGWSQVPGLWVRPRRYEVRVWHARRNNEMLFGLLLRAVLRMPIKLLFTSAAQRRHSAYTRFLIRRMHAVIATSTRSGSFLQVPHTVIQHGVDLNLFHPPEGPADRMAATDLPGRYLIGCFGRVRHQKGTDLFVQAMIELLPNHPDWTAIVCGRVTPEHKVFADGLTKAVADAGLSDRIRFMGEVNDIRPWYRRATLYVAPSRNEGFGLTPLEAMASQTAVVASDAGAYAEMIVPGETGMVVPAGDGPALTAAIETYLADPDEARRQGQNAVVHVRSNFALEKEATAIAAVYAGLLGEKRSL
ncbi:MULTISPECIES: glycosyltransferase family 4 protein [Rhizobium]|uniref:Glycosyltransferase family 4 protein n=1 Tax=Rhizobium rhododendri TaxID=2506430 RepID=A0ABY8IDT5_9HYPH|nr:MULTISPECIES: glycosyltransferase family 4 protein [Rhizobium]MBZ5758644.1 glycosyltransferase family 4 protein [Rhizobium sp. VS19-DR96]MBZ5764526.1 glycosyltransferase family 4 protein [Rhizobium sp. VS19-DR129.2]MBZ5772069.1 glycosyltransferase family 4 protein [Rhizobium sp. VS19-DRK62.2]MBZ5783244.1 glycosyltransferase family 4 protein [Rhizobium sp. VS19-DR121]MBZ5800692.1 glycosyltransferase family 4 protein [Rhizobium sp. VS19-DR181]